jgi:hypothetical protein
MTSEPTTRQAIASLPNPERLPGVTSKVRKAVEAMVWQGLHRRDAAKLAGLAEHSLYQALRRSPVRALYLQQLDVLRTSERARNIHALVGVRDGSGNDMARVQAVKAIEQIDTVEATRGGFSGEPTQAGLVIQIVTTSPPTVKTIEHEPARRDDAGD